VTVRDQNVSLSHIPLAPAEPNCSRPPSQKGKERCPALVHGNIVAVSAIFGWAITPTMLSTPEAATWLLSTFEIDASFHRLWELENVCTSIPPDPENSKVEVKGFVKPTPAMDMEDTV